MSKNPISCSFQHDQRNVPFWHLLLLLVIFEQRTAYIRHKYAVARDRKMLRNITMSKTVSDCVLSFRFNEVFGCTQASVWRFSIKQCASPKSIFGNRNQYYNHLEIMSKFVRINRHRHPLTVRHTHNTDTQLYGQWRRFDRIDHPPRVCENASPGVAWRCVAITQHQSLNSPNASAQ